MPDPRSAFHSATLYEHHVIKNEKLALDRLQVRLNVFLVIIIIINDSVAPTVDITL